MLFAGSPDEPLAPEESHLWRCCLPRNSALTVSPACAQFLRAAFVCVSSCGPEDVDDGQKPDDRHLSPFGLPCLSTVEANKTLEKSLFLKNTSEYAVAFKVKTTAPKRYCVRPNSSVIKAHESVEVRIVMQARSTDSRRHTMFCCHVLRCDCMIYVATIADAPVFPQCDSPVVALCMSYLAFD